MATPAPPGAPTPSSYADPRVGPLLRTHPRSPVPEPMPDPGPPGERPTGTIRSLVRAAHPRFAALTALGTAAAAALSGREPREVAVVLATVLVGSSILGWHNDLVDRARDQKHLTPGKPLAAGRLEPGTVWFALACGVLLLVPLSVTSGITAASAYLLAVLVGVLGNVALRGTPLSWVTWAASYALLPAFLSHGGWGGQTQGDPPGVAMTALAALLGVGVHVLSGRLGLPPEDADGWRSLPLLLGRRLGSARLLRATSLYLVLVGAAILALGATRGLSA